MNSNVINQVSSDKNEYLSKLHKIVQQTIEEEGLIINNLLHPPEDILSRGQKLSDKVARFGGSWKFIALFGIVLAIWIAYNVTVLSSMAFDPYPFILMNLILSCIAALQAPIIMMSQNRQEEKDRQRAQNDYMVNMKAELEIRSLHQKIDHLIKHQQQELLELQRIQIEMMNDILSRVTTVNV